MSHTPLQSACPRVSIVGAGISGLALACHLQARKIPFNIYDARNAQTTGHSYGITLRNHALKSFKNSSFPKEHLVALRQKTAVDRAVGGTGKVSDQSPKTSATFQAVDRDFRRWLVELLTKQGGSIYWEHKLVAIRAAADGSAELCFDGREPTLADLVIDAGGLRAPCFDYGVEAAPKPRLLPYATYYGVRRLQSQDFLDKYAHYFGEGNTIELAAEAGTSAPFISLQKVHLGEPGQRHHEVELRWVYSRPPKAGSDPLYRPYRTASEAKDIPPELYNEILSSTQLHFSQKKRAMLAQFFNLDDLHNDRILNWHLRARLPPRDYFVANADHKGYQVLPIGDAAHGFPIVKSNGAEAALRDAKLMASFISDEVDRRLGGPGGVPRTRKSPFRYGRWYKQTQDAIQDLRNIHGQHERTAVELADIIGFKYEPTGIDDEIGDSSSEVDFNIVEDKGRL